MGASLNQLNIIGRLTGDPKLTTTANGKALCKFSLAVDNWGKDAGATFFNCAAFEKKADVIAQYTSKGALVHISGRIQSRRYTDQASGEERTVWDVTVNDVVLLSSKKDTEQAARAGDSEYNPQTGQTQVRQRGPAEQSFDRAYPPQSSRPADTGMDDIPF